MLKPRIRKLGAASSALLILACAGLLTAYGQSDVTQPGDPIIASSSNSPGSEGVANAIDGKPTKYLNFDTRTGGKPSGFVVTPSVGVTVVTGMTLQSANDAPERDPKLVTLEGSNDDAITAFDVGNWEPITTLADIPAFATRFQTQVFSFANTKPYKHYRWTVVETQTSNGCCLQIAEVELLGTLLPLDVTLPGDPIIASSSNSPGSEGVANAIDGKPTKYLNFDTRIGGTPSGFAVTPSIGVTRVVGMSLQSANDAPERDPKVVTLEGSNDATLTDFASGNWELITRLDDIPAFSARFQTKYFTFENAKPYRHYRWTVIETQTANGCCLQIAEVELLGSALPPDVTQPGDPVIASSSNSPGSEGVANAIDNKPTKYLNFDTRTGGKPSGLIVTPSIGKTLVTGMTLQSANDAPERDPKVVTLEGSNDDDVTDFASGNWELIVRLDNIPAFTARFQTQPFLFENCKPYKHYRWTVLETQTSNGCCLQIAEIELLGTGGPQDVTQAGDAVLASSSNSPGSEGVANAIDNKPTKYLNFDTRIGGTPSGFVVTPSVGPTTIIGTTMQSANDAPERDPKVVTIEGSNDNEIASFSSGTWELIARLDDIPAFPNRFQTQEFYFCNKKPYKHYRWTVLETQTANGCCLQVAEVEFLAVVEGAPCNVPGKVQIVSQPVDTPALEGQRATFNIAVNGPWPLQWLRNGQPIPGATKTTYSTDPVTPQNASDVYACKIVGTECPVSQEVMAVIFKPSDVKSLGISFVGGGANGAPTAMFLDDIAGVHLQAFWNNAGAGSGQLPDFNVDPPVLFTDSSAAETTVTFEWQTNGTWGAGTGNSTPTQRMLNGLVGAEGTGDPGTFTFSNVPEPEAGKAHAVLVYAVGPPLQFQNVSLKITGTTEETYYIRTINSDEYNAAPGFYRGTSKDRNNPTVANFVRFDGVRPLGGTITLTVETLTPGFDRETGVNGLQLVLNAPPPVAAPIITADPQPTVVAAGGTATVSVTATGQNLTYQWRKAGRDISDGGNVSGATTAALSIGSFSDADEGIYSVAVANEGGIAVSKNASIRLSKFDIKDALVGNWKLDETSGSTAANAVAGGKPGEVNGTPNWVAGQIANAFSFDGASYLFVADYPLAKKQIGASAWVNVTGGTATDVAVIRNAQGALTVSGGAQRIVGQFELGLVFDANDGLLKPMAAVGIGPNVARATGTAAFPTDSWHHLAFSADGAQLRLYVDGVQVVVEDYLAEINPPDIPYLSIGARLDLDTSEPPVLGPDPDAPNLMLGPLDDIALWTRALTADEVARIYAAGKLGQPVESVIVKPPVVAGTLEVKLDQSNVTVSWDHGTLQTAPTVAGPWTDSAATSPVTEPISPQGAKYYRTLSQ